jgi:hypothetical protein
MNCVVINHQKRREIQSASWPLIVLVIMTEAPNWRPERGSEWEMIKILHEGYGFSNKSNTTYPTLM